MGRSTEHYRRLYYGATTYTYRYGYRWLSGF